jgi:gliding motility-associated-like protein
MKTRVLFLLVSLTTTMSFSQLLQTKPVDTIANTISSDQSEEIEASDLNAETPHLTQYEKQLKASRNQVLFEENKGQVKDQHWQPRPDVLYYGQTEGIDFHIRNNGISYQLNRLDSWKDEDDLMDELGFENSENHQVPDQTTMYRVDINWINAQLPQAEAQDSRPGYNNYYNVPDGVAPALYVKQYEKLTLKNLWPGVDMEYYSRNGHLESDWIVQQAEDYKLIAFEVKGAELRIEDGALIMKTPLGEIAEGTLKTFQNNRELPSYWKLRGNVVSLEIENYNPKEPIRIDPPVRIWGTYYGGSDVDMGRSCIVDDSGNVYLAGQTRSTNAIATSGAHQTTNGGSYDAFLVKFDNNGVRQWGTYYGGSAYENAFSCALDNSGNVYLAGSTSSTNAIATVGAHQTTNGVGSKAFLVKFDTNGVRQWGTYYGGNLTDIGYSCAVDNSGNVYLAGETQSTNAIASPGAHQTVYGGGIWDAFLVKFNTNGVRQWGTYCGGSDSDIAYSCAVDGSGNVYLTGQTRSTNAIASPGTHQTTHGGDWDVFLVKFNTNGVRQWGTYCGGNDQDRGFFCAADGNGNIYLTGETRSTNAIASPGAHQTAYGGGNWDAFLVKFNTNGVRQWGTYYGGTGIERGSSCAIDGNGNIYLAGYTASTSAIATVGAYQTTNSGSYDAFLVKFNTNGVRQWGTYYGGVLSDWGQSCSMDGNGSFYLAGRTSSSNDIATSGAHQTAYGGATYDAFLVKFVPECTVDEPSSVTVCINIPITNITYTTVGATGIGAASGLPTGVSADFAGNTITISGTPTAAGTFNYTIPLTGGCGNVEATGTIIVNTEDNTVSSGSNSTTICVNTTMSNITHTTTGATGIGAVSGLPTGVTANFSGNIITISGTPTITGTFNYSIPLTGGCGSVEATGTIVVEPENTVSSASSSPEVCVNTVITNITHTTTGATGIGTVSGLPTGTTANFTANTITISGTPTIAGTFNYTIPLTGGCGSLEAIGTITVNPNPTASASHDGPVCMGDEVNFSASGGVSYSWTGPGGFTNGNQNFTLGSAVPADEGVYEVTVTDVNGCSATDQTTFSLNPSAVLTISAENVSCNGENDGAANVIATGSGPFTYSWSPGGFSSAEVSDLSPDTYTITVTDANGCITIDNVSIEEPDAIDLTFTTTDTDCDDNNGAAAVNAIGGAGGFTYFWSPENQTSSSITNLAAGGYQVTVTDASGCSITDSLTINYVNAPTLSVEQVHHLTCHGSSDGSATIVGTGGSPPYNYSWSPMGGSSATAENLSAGTYTVTVTDDDSCPSFIEVTINEPAMVVIDGEVTDALCGNFNGTIDLSVSGGTGNYSYSWTPLGLSGNSLNELAPGNYSVVVTDANGCEQTANYTVGVTGNIALSVTPQVVTIVAGENTQLQANVGAGVTNETYTWTPSEGLSCTNCPDPIASPSETTTYTVTVTTDDGCLSSDTVLVIVEYPCTEIFIPTIFSPNGDNLNDLVCVEGSCIRDLDFRIYNRWGEVVFQTKDQAACWDGTQNGKTLNTGVFVFKAIIVTDDGQKITKAGSLTLVR